MYQLARLYVLDRRQAQISGIIIHHAA